MAELVKDGIQKHQEKDIKALKIELKDRKHITIIIVSAILVIILSIIYLTIIGRGTAGGSMLTILAKMFSAIGE